MRIRKHLFVGLLGAIGAMLAAGCGDDDDAAGVTVTEAPGDDVGFSGDDTAVVVVGDDTFVVRGEPGEECIDIGDECVALGDAQGQFCDQDDAQYDVIVVDGEVVEVICYPSAENADEEVVVADTEGNTEVPQNANGSVVTFDETTDGVPIEGNVETDAERVAIFGNGVDVTVIDGNVAFASNNSRVRGLTITGNLTYADNSNNSAASFCKVHGNLQVTSNGFVATNCVVFGDVQVDGNNATLVNIGVQGAWQVNGSALCDGCYSFSDSDGDFDVIDEEIGDALTCGG